MSSGTAQVEQAALCQDDDTVAIWEDEAVALRLDVLPLDALPAHEASHVNLIVKVTNVAHNGIVLHLGHGSGHDDVLVASGGDEEIAGVKAVLQRQHCVTCKQQVEIVKHTS